MALQFFTSDILKESCCLEPTRCEGEFDRDINFNETITLWKSTESVKGTFYLKLSAAGTPSRAVAIFTIKKADKTTISRKVERGAIYVVTEGQVVEVTVQVKNGPSDQTASIGFRYCDQDIIKAETCKKQCCPIPLECQQLFDSIFPLGSQPLFTWETFFPVKGVLEFFFISTFNPSDHPIAIIRVERSNKEDIQKTIPLNVTNTGTSVVPFILTVDDIKKVTATVLGVQENQSRVDINLCHQEEINSFCCNDPLKCEAFIGFGQLTLNQSIKIWKTIMPVKGTYAFTNLYEQEATVTIRFFNGESFKKTLERFGGFGITANDVKDITIGLDEQSTQEGAIQFQYCVQDIPTHKSCGSSCCPHPLQCSNLGIQSYNNPQGQKIPLWISKVPVDGEILFLVKGQPQQRTKVIIKRYRKPDIIRSVEGERIFIVRTTDFKGVFVEFENGDPNNNSIEIRPCIQEQVCQDDTLRESSCKKSPYCCPKPVRCEYETDLLLNTVELPLNRNIVLWESTERIKGTFSMRNISTDAVMAVSIQYKDGSINTRVLEPGEGFMITDKGIVQISIRFSSENAQAIGEVRFESCTENILEQNKKDNCCPHPLICQDLAAEAENIASNKKYLLWHTDFPVEAMMEFLLYNGETATIMIERYGKSTITETISFAVSKILAVDHIKRVYVKVNGGAGVGSIFMETCMQEQLPLKGDEDDGITVINR